MKTIPKKIAEHLFFIKDIHSFNEAAAYLDLSKSHLYRLTSNNDIPFFRPGGRKIYFKRADLDAWMLRNPIKSNFQIEREASLQSLLK
ncbi:helix-turn-helix domain protein [Dokdonia sp. MED134]|uniref:helix-turn-helix domain-containing protein n=1 Tax=Dokdonia sp. MED134 TaxID=313590 RepID=UPI000068D00B|nr:helix-turn-helix domain-containing protein [Dokdonia sp. MED134]AIN49944.1 helix-turn-helix domain protein [Dokdonia sp. MED134]